MPGYLTNRYIAFNPTAEVQTVSTAVSALALRVTEAESNIDDLSLNIGV
jgi:hypothetical protein